MDAAADIAPSDAEVIPPSDAKVIPSSDAEIIPPSDVESDAEEVESDGVDNSQQENQVHVGSNRTLENFKISKL